VVVVPYHHPPMAISYRKLTEFALYGTALQFHVNPFFWPEQTWPEQNFMLSTSLIYMYMCDPDYIYAPWCTAFSRGLCVKLKLLLKAKYMEYYTEDGKFWSKINCDPFPQDQTQSAMLKPHWMHCIGMAWFVNPVSVVFPSARWNALWLDCHGNLIFCKQIWYFNR